MTFTLGKCTRRLLCWKGLLYFSGASEVEAMGLMAYSGGGCYFIWQPETEEEIEQAINTIAVSCVSAVRYGGTDQKIIKRLYSLNLESECDYKLKV